MEPSEARLAGEVATALRCDLADVSVLGHESVLGSMVSYTLAVLARNNSDAAVEARWL